MSRRGFIRSGAIAGAVAGALPALGSSLFMGVEPQQQGAIKLGVCSYSFHKFDRAHVIDFVHQLKTPWLNAKDISDHLPSTSEAAEAAAVADYKAAGIELTSAGVIYFAKPDEADIRAKFEYAKRSGVKVIVGSPTKEVLPMMDSFVKQYDMRLAIHNHGPEDKEWPSPLDILKAVGSMDKRIGLCMDMGHTARALNGSPTAVIDAIHKAEARLFDVHIKDLADLTKKESQVAVGEGKMPIRGIFEALNAIGYKGYVDLEYEIHDDDPLPGMMKSFAYMRGVLKEQGLGNRD